MKAAVHGTELQPALEGDYRLPGSLRLAAGGVLERPTLHYALYGKLNAARDNVVFVPHALSGSARVADWWPALFGGNALVDLERDCIVGVNFLGSPYGSTGPLSVNPETGKRFGSRFPLVSIQDNVRAQAMLFDSLGVTTLKLTLGGSIGGMQVLQWAIDYPDRVTRAVCVGAAKLGGMGLAMNHIQREVIRLGTVLGDGAGRRGLALARELAVCTYKSTELFATRFARKPDRSGEDPYADAAGTASHEGRFDVAGYLDYQGNKFSDRFDADSYVAITRMMDTYDPAIGYPGAHAAFSRIRASVRLVGISSDALFPSADVRALADEISAAGAECCFRELISDHGHDAFLAEPELLFALLA